MPALACTHRLKLKLIFKISLSLSRCMLASAGMVVSAMLHTAVQQQLRWKLGGQSLCCVRN
jgi:hypothetical protein